MNRSTALLSFFVLATAILLSCNKSSTGGTGDPGGYSLSYGDSIIYLRPTTGDYIVNPVTPSAGTYAGFPEGIEIDGATGAINVTKSETGLRYRITHTATGGAVTTTYVVISGITFKDKFYHLAANDSLALPIYNASETRVLPLSGSNFDDDHTANSGGCSIRTDNGTINLAQCVRNGIFGATPRDDDRKDFDITYRVNDASGRSLNKIRVRIYYYSSMTTVAPDLLQTLSDRQNDGVFLRGVANETAQQAAKPRPPCVIIIAN